MPTRLGKNHPRRMVTIRVTNWFVGSGNEEDGRKLPNFVILSVACGLTETLIQYMLPTLPIIPSVTFLVVPEIDGTAFTISKEVTNDANRNN